MISGGGPFPLLFAFPLGQQVETSGGGGGSSVVTGGIFELLHWSALGQQVQNTGGGGIPVINYTASHNFFYRNRRKHR